jgi:hypothetical protein
VDDFDSGWEPYDGDDLEAWGQQEAWEDGLADAYSDWE